MSKVEFLVRFNHVKFANEEEQKKVGLKKNQLLSSVEGKFTIEDPNMTEEEIRSIALDSLKEKAFKEQGLICESLEILN
jgi:hypothetical protein